MHFGPWFGFLAIQAVNLLNLSYSGSIPSGWSEDSFTSGIYCSANANICVRLFHLVLWIQPTNPLITYVGGGYINFDNENDTKTLSWQSINSQIDFEQKYLEFTQNETGIHKSISSQTISNRTYRGQVYNFGYESFFTIDMYPIFNISCMNVKLFFMNLDNISNDTNIQYLVSPECVKLDNIELNMPYNYNVSSYYDHGNSTIECSLSLNKCRLLVHIVFKYSPKGDFINNYNYIGNGELYINNNGTIKTNLTGNFNVVWEKSMIFKNDTWYHGSNWGFDHIGNFNYLSKYINYVCGKIYVFDLQGDNIHYIPMNGRYGGYQQSQYVRCYQPTVHFWD